MLLCSAMRLPLFFPYNSLDSLLRPPKEYLRFYLLLIFFPLIWIFRVSSPYTWHWTFKHRFCFRLLLFIFFFFLLIDYMCSGYTCSCKYTFNSWWLGSYFFFAHAKKSGKMKSFTIVWRWKWKVFQCVCRFIQSLFKWNQFFFVRRINFSDKCVFASDYIEMYLNIECCVCLLFYYYWVSH